MDDSHVTRASFGLEASFVRTCYSHDHTQVNNHIHQLCLASFCSLPHESPHTPVWPVLHIQTPPPRSFTFSETAEAFIALSFIHAYLHTARSGRLHSQAQIPDPVPPYSRTLHQRTTTYHKSR